MPRYNPSYMQDQNLPCPRCPKISHSQEELLNHMRYDHKLSESEISRLRGRGYFEEKTATRDGDVALEHQKAAIKSQAGNAINIPFVPPPERKRIASAPAGWQRTIEGYLYEKLILQQNTIDSIIKKVLKGSVIANHAILEIYTYRRDTGALSELQDKERTLEARRVGYVSGDPEDAEIAKQLVGIKTKIKEIKHDVGVDTEKETVSEVWFSGDLGSDDHTEWQEKFMQKALLEAEQVREPKQEIKL